MNCLERFICALEYGQPDRVPIYEGAINQAVVEAICPGGTYHDLIEKLDLDMVRITEGTSFEPVDETKGLYKDKWGITYKKGNQFQDYPIAGPIQSREDLHRYRPPDPMDPIHYRDLPKTLARFKGQRAIIWKGLDGFSTASFLRGMEQLMLDMLLEPEMAFALMEMANEFQTRVAVEAVRRGAEIVVLLDDYADNKGPLMGVKLFQKFVLPYLRKTVQTIKDAGGYVIKHTDGNIWPILDMIVDTGIDAINPLEPTAGMDIGEVKRRLEGRVCVIGNVDCGELLCRGTQAEVRQAVRECIRAASPGGGHIISSSNSIQFAVRPENYVAMVDEAHRYGQYPLTLD